MHVAAADILKDIDGSLASASNMLLNNGLSLFPTDTTYALGVNALSEVAIDKVYALKLRPPQKPIHVIVSNLEMAEEFVYINDDAYKLAERFLPGALTIILNHKNNVPGNLVAGYSSLGIRIPNNPISIALASATGVPLTATSANISGRSEVYSVEDFIAQIESFNPMGRIDIIVDQGRLPVVKPSTIIDLTGKEVKLIREGPISLSQIYECLYGKSGV